MKTYAYIAAIAFSALVTPVVGHESMLTSDEQETSNLRRSLIGSGGLTRQETYLSIFCRCWKVRLYCFIMWIHVLTIMSWCRFIRPQLTFIWLSLQITCTNICYYHLSSSSYIVKRVSSSGDDEGNPVDDFTAYPDCDGFKDKKEPARTECSCPVRNKSFVWYSPRDKWNAKCEGKIKDIAFPN